MKRELAVVLACLALASGCGFFHGLLVPRQPLPTVPGPESPELARSTRLQLAEVRRDGSRILLRRLSDGSVTELQTSDGIGGLSGPDRDGRVAYLAMTTGTRRSTYVWIDSIDAAPPVQAFPLRPGEKHFSIGDFALSPVGGRLAFVSTRTSGVEALELLDLASGEVRTLRSRGCLDFAWFPDGKRLVFTDYSGTAGGRGSMYVLDCTSGALVGGWDAGSLPTGLWVGPGGNHVFLATGRDRALWRFDVATGQHEAWSLPGLRLPIAFSEDGKLVGYALPTEGSKPEYASSPIYGSTPKYAIKLFDLASGASCTVAPPVGRFEMICGGELAE